MYMRLISLKISTKLIHTILHKFTTVTYIGMFLSRPAQYPTCIYDFPYRRTKNHFGPKYFKNVGISKLWLNPHSKAWV